MMNSRLPIIATFILSIVSFIASAQNEVEMADVMRTNGKIYVVVTVIVVIFIALVVYMISLDRKVSGIESQLLNFKKSHLEIILEMRKDEKESKMDITKTNGSIEDSNTKFIS